MIADAQPAESLLGILASGTAFLVFVFGVLWLVNLPCRVARCTRHRWHNGWHLDDIGRRFRARGEPLERSTPARQYRTR